MIRRIILAAVVCMVAFCITLIASDANTGLDGTTVYVRDTTGDYTQRPHRLSFGYPALFPGFKITAIHWDKWYREGLGEGTGASGRGWLHYDTCKPDCADGKYRRVRTLVFLGRIHRCHGRRVYGMVQVFPRHLPPGHPHRIECSGFLH